MIHFSNIMLKWCNRVIEYSFYAIFLLVPLAFTDKTSELFELNKMWLTWGLTIVIAMAWIIKMILQRRFFIQRTPLDIPIVLFLLSQIISTIFSMDSHVSLWGYYSRFNGGLLSIISYIFLYYAFVSNFISREKHESVREFRENFRDFSETNAIKMVKRLLLISLISGLVVSLWGLPSHFGYDPTCLIFRGDFDVSCWTQDFQPRVRIFSTLGQPNWLAAYLAILIPIALAFMLRSWKMENGKWKLWIYPILYALFLLAFFYSRSQSGFLGLVIGLFVFFALYLWTSKPFNRLTMQQFLLPVIACLLFLVTLFIAGPPIQRFNAFSLDAVISKLTTDKTGPSTEAAQGPALEYNITSSGNIRSVVWRGAWEIFKHHPLFGTGTETFAFAYYKYKLPEQNLTSEWNFLYNKAHNEYLNYLATTGFFGLGTYLLMTGVFLWTVLTKNANSFAKFAKQFVSVREENESISKQNSLLILALLSGYIATLVINFFGFSVVITNIYLFLIPAFVFVLNGMIDPQKTLPQKSEVSGMQWTGVTFICLIGLYFLYSLWNSWNADKAYAYGYNLDRAGSYEQAYPYLRQAVSQSPEPVFQDELSINAAVLTTAVASQKDESPQAPAIAASLAQEAITTSNDVISKHPNNVIFWKGRTRVFVTISQVDARYLPKALEAIQSAAKLAPNDANISYNLGVLYGQNDDLDNAIKTLERTKILKPDYKDTRYALGLFYHQNKEQEKAEAEMEYILKYISPNDPATLEALKSWGRP